MEEHKQKFYKENNIYFNYINDHCFNVCHKISNDSQFIKCFEHCEIKLYSSNFFQNSLKDNKNSIL